MAIDDQADLRTYPFPPAVLQARPDVVTVQTGPGATAENPKAAQGRKKARYFFVPAIFSAVVGVVMELGARKYGPFNWRAAPIKSSDYIDAIHRHIDAWADGQDLDPESKTTHLAHVAASCAILIDAQAVGALIDDRAKSGQVTALFEKMSGKAT